MIPQLPITGVLGAIFILLSNAALQFLLSAALYDAGWRVDIGDPLFTGLVTFVSGAVIIALYCRGCQCSLSSLLHHSPNSRKATLLLVALPLMVIAISSVVWLSEVTQWMSSWFPISPDEWHWMQRLLTGGWPSLLAVCIVAPLIEELLFRGIILRGLLRHYSVSTAILLSTSLFAAAHLTLIQLPTTYLVGALLGWLYVRTHSLWPSIFAHAVHNLSVWIVWQLTDVPLQHEGVLPGFEVSTILFSIVATGAGVTVLWKLLHPCRTP